MLRERLNNYGGYKKVIKYFALSCLSLLSGPILADILSRFLEMVTDIGFDEGVMGAGFTIVFFCAVIKDARQKERPEQKERKQQQEKEEKPLHISKKDNNKDKLIVKIYCYIDKLTSLKVEINDDETNALVSKIIVLLDRIAKEVEADSRDRKKIRNLSESTGDMIVALISKYVKLENQKSHNENIQSSLAEIVDALKRVEESLSLLLDDLFSNDMMEVSSTIAVLDNIMESDSGSKRISVKE